MLTFYACPKPLIMLFSFSIPIVLPGHLVNFLLCVISFIFYLLLKHFGTVRIKLGGKKNLPKGRYPMVCVPQFAPGSATDPRPFPTVTSKLRLWGQMLFQVHFLFFWADQSLCYCEEQTLYIKQKLHQLEVVYLHKMWSLYFLIPSTGFLHSELFADVTSVVKRMITWSLLPLTSPALACCWQRVACLHEDLGLR